MGKKKKKKEQKLIEKNIKTKEIRRAIAIPQNIKSLLFYFVFFSVLFVSFSLKILFLNQIKSMPDFYKPLVGTDMETYDTYAHKIAKGEETLLFTKTGGILSFAPFYVQFLSMIYSIFGHNLYLTRVIQILIGIIANIIIFLITKEIFNRTSALITLILLSFYNAPFMYEVTLLYTTLFILLFSLLLFILLKLYKTNFKFYFSIIAGIVLGLCCLTRPNMVLFLPFIFLWLLLIKVPLKKLLSNYLTIVIISTLIISTITIRNYMLTKDFILISGHGGRAFWIGNYPRADGIYSYPHEKFAEVEEKIEKMKSEGKLKKPSQVDKLWYNEITSYWKKHPKEFFRLYWSKFRLFWGTWEIPNNVDWEYFKSWSSILRLPLFSFGLIAPLGISGMLFSLKKWRETSLFIGTIIIYMFATIAYFVVGRHRLPVVVPLSVFSGYFVYYTVVKLSKNYRYAIFPIFTFLLFFILINARDIGRFFHLQFYNSGVTEKISKKMYQIRDDSGLWRGRQSSRLLSNMIKKDIIFNFDTSIIKYVYLFISYQLYSPDGHINIRINDSNEFKIECQKLDYSGTPKIIYVPLNPNLLKLGLNSFVFSSTNNNFFVLVDTYYDYDRSSYKEGEKDWNYNNLTPYSKLHTNGEYMIRLIIEVK